MEAEGAVDSMAGLAITGREIMEAAEFPRSGGGAHQGAAI